MLNISSKKEGNDLVIIPNGRIDSSSSPQFDEYIKSLIANATNLVFDFANIEYISSAGLRVVLATQKTMSNKGTFKIINTTPDVKEIFDITGFSDIITIE